MSHPQALDGRAELYIGEGSLDARGRVAHLLSRTIFFSLLALIALAAIPYGTVEAWWVAVFECAVFALTILWLMEGMISGFWLVRSQRLLWPLLALILLGFVQSVPLESLGREVAGIRIRHAISADPFQTKLVALRLLAILLAWAMLLRYTTNGRRLRALVYTVIAVGVVTALFGIVRQTTHHGPGGFVLPYLRAETGYGQFINKNHFAFLMEMVLGLALGIVIGKGVRRDHVMIYLALALPVWTALVLSNSRGGIFAMLAQMLFLGALFAFLPSARGTVKEHGSAAPSIMERTARSIALRVILLTGLLFVVLIGALWIGGEQLATRLESVQGEVTSVGGDEGASRREIWQATWTLIKDHPVAGVGLGGYRVVIPEYHRASGRLTPQEAHNDYLELMASGGLLGVALLIWFLVIFIRSARKGLRTTDRFARAASIGALVGLFGVAIHSFVDFGLHIIINSLVFVVLLSISAGEGGEKGAGPSVWRARS